MSYETCGKEMGGSDNKLMPKIKPRLMVPFPFPFHASLSLQNLQFERGVYINSD